MKEDKDIVSLIRPKETAVPENDYFKQLAQDVISSQTPAKVVPMYKRPILWISSAAAAILILISLSPFTSNEPNVLAKLDEIPTSSVVAYIEEHASEFEVTEIVEVLDNEDLTLAIESKEVSLEISTGDIFNDISKEDIESYFDANYIDWETLDEEEFYI